MSINQVIHVVEGYKVSGIEAVKHGYTWYTRLTSLVFDGVLYGKHVYGYRPRRFMGAGGKLR